MTRMFRLFLVCISALVITTIPCSMPPSSQLSCWVWKSSDLIYADSYNEWVLYQGDITLEGAQYFVKRGLYPAYLGGREPTLLFRLYALPDVKFLRDQISYAIEQWKIHDTTVKQIQLDYDAPSSKLESYAYLITELKRTLPEVGISVTGLVTWYDDNPDGLVILGENIDYIVFQLYQDYAPLAATEQYARRLASYPFPYKLGITMHKSFLKFRLKKGRNYIGTTVFINTRS